MNISIRPQVNLGIAFEQFRQSDQKKASNFASQHRKVYAEVEDGTIEDVREHLASLSLEELRSKATPDLASWTPETLQDLLARGVVTNDNAQACFRHYRPFLECALARSQVKLDVPLPPNWVLFDDLLRQMMPTDKKSLEIYLASGLTTIAGIDFSGKDLKDVDKRLQGIRSSVRRWMQQCLEAGIDLLEFVAKVIVADRLDLVPILVGKSICYYDIRNLYTMVSELYPGKLPPWPLPPKPASLKYDAWPSNIKEGIDAYLYDPVRNYDATTIKTHKQSFASYFGIIEAIVGPLEMFTSALPPDGAQRILIQGWPADFCDKHFAEATPLEMVKALAGSTALRTELLEGMRSLREAYDGRGSYPSPLIQVYLEDRYSRTEYAAARNLLKVAKTMLEELKIRDRHAAWLKKLGTEVATLERSKTTNYDRKKQALFREPMTWLYCVRRMLPEAEKLLALPSPLSCQELNDFRDTFYFLMALCFPLRPENYEEMRIGQNYDPAKYHIHFEEEEVKNEIEINHELPSTGSLSILRALSDRYFDEVRPALLCGRRSDFVFVPNGAWKTAGIRIGERGFNEILQSISKAYLSDVLPPGVKHLNPHAMRHLAAVYQIAVISNYVLASQLLGDRLETVLKYYSDVRYSAKQAVRSFLEQFSIDTDGEEGGEKAA